MNNSIVNCITPFVPAKNYDLSLRFYKDLGFIEIAKIDNAVRLEIDGCGFWLQDYYVKDFADNSMLCLYVNSLESWWSEVKKLKINENYEGKAKVFSEPHQQEGGLMMQLADPSGVLWHVREGN
jgi:catechol 2,3-dioxygenase-like lactoylglutathione lyase family enzyme